MKSKILVLVWLLLIASCSENKQSVFVQNGSDLNNIMNGQKVEDTKLRSAVVRLGGNCSGAYIGNRVVLTAAHCKDSFSTAKFNYFSSNAFACTIEPKSQSDAGEDNLKNDLMKLKVICPEGKLSEVTPFVLDDGQMASELEESFASGYGYKALEVFDGHYWFPPKDAEAVDLTFVSLGKETTYAKTIEGIVPEYKKIMTKNGSLKLIADLEKAGKSAFYKTTDCKAPYKGDSGGPIYYYNHKGEMVLKGVVSGGLADSKSKTCYTVFGPKISKYISWINK